MLSNEDSDAIGKFERLSLFQSEQRAELEYRRSREFQVFVWSSALLVGLSAALLATPPSDSGESFIRSGYIGRDVATALIAVLTVFSVRWQTIQRDRQRGPSEGARTDRRGAWRVRPLRR